jgi:hypothetical protein
VTWYDDVVISSSPLSGSVKLLVGAEEFVEPLEVAWDAERR